MIRRLPLAAFALAALGAVFAACGDESGSGGVGGDPGPKACNDDLEFCDAGATCWLDEAGDFACLPSGDGLEGAPCQHWLGFPTCVDDLVCLQLDSSVPGVCAAQCLPLANTCAGLTCTAFQSPKGEVIYACGSASAAGAAGGAGGGGAGGG